MKKVRLTRAGGDWPERLIFMIHNPQKLVHMQRRALVAESDYVRKIASSQSSSSLSFSADAREKGRSLFSFSLIGHIQLLTRLHASNKPVSEDEKADDVFSRRHLYCGTPVVTSWAVAGQQVMFLHMYLQTRVTLRAFPIATPKGRSSSSHGGEHELFMSKHSRWDWCTQG